MITFCKSPFIYPLKILSFRLLLYQTLFLVLIIQCWQQVRTSISDTFSLLVLFYLYLFSCMVNRNDKILKSSFYIGFEIVVMRHQKFSLICSMVKNLDTNSKLSFCCNRLFPPICCIGLI